MAADDFLEHVAELVNERVELERSYLEFDLVMAMREHEWDVQKTVVVNPQTFIGDLWPTWPFKLFYSRYMPVGTAFIIDDETLERFLREPTEMRT